MRTTIRVMLNSLSFPFSMQELKECFASRSIPRLQEVLARMPKEESAYHMKRCIDSGLWVPDAKAAGQSCTYTL